MKCSDAKGWCATGTDDLASLPAHVADFWRQPALPKDKPTTVRRESESLDPMRLTTFADLLDADLADSVEWLADGILPKVGCGFIAAPPKHLKSWIALDLLVALVGGGQFLERDIEPDNERQVLYVAGEGRAGALRKRLDWLCNGRNLHAREVGQRLHISVSPDLMLNGDPKLSSLRKAIEGIQPHPSVVILDPLSRLHTVDENSRNEMEPILTALRRLSEDYNTLVLLVHHARKKSAGTAPDPLRGTSAFRGWLDVLISLDAASDESVVRKLRAELRDGAPFGPVNIRLKVSELAESATLEFCEGEAPSPSAAEQRKKKLIAELVANGPMSTSSLRSVLRCNGNSFKSLIDSVLGKQIDGMRIEAIQGDRNTVLYQANPQGQLI